MPRSIPLRCPGNSRDGARNSQWKGGRIQDGNGYFQVLLKPGDQFYSMTNARDYVLEHRLKMAQHLGRCLASWECVHHKNGDKACNNIENLELMPRGTHDGITILERRIRKLESRVAYLENKLAKLEAGGR